MNAAETIRAAAAVPVNAVALPLDRAELDELVAALDELDWLREEIKTVRAERDYAKSTALRPANGHWYVENGAYARVGEIADLDTARVRVALQRALPDACKALLEIKGKHSAHDAVSAVLDAVARRYEENA